MKILNKKTDKIPEGAVFVGRPSPFGNPFVIGRDGTREEVIRKYRAHFEDMLKDAEFREKLKGIMDAPALVCFCAPLPCHAEVIREAVLGLKRRMRCARRPVHEARRPPADGSR